MGSNAASAPASGAQPGRVLLVDDEEAMRRVLNHVLRRAGHTTVEAATAMEAMALVRTGGLDLVVSDVHMPEMDGVELLQAIREVDDTLPVLLLSGAPDLETAMKAVRLGAFEYIPKPVESERLVASAARAIEQCRARRLEQNDLRRFRSNERVRKGPEGRAGVSVQAGTLLGGKYRIGRQLGEGGMGAVFEAVREDLAQMKVALKVLHPHVQDDAEHLARFRREAETVARIFHPNIVRILDFQATDDEPAFLVMELLEGTSLARAINDGGPFATGRAVFVASQVLSALGAAHAAGIVHRDLKPDNVFLTRISGLEDVVKLLDFGIAKVSAEPTQPRLTRTGAILGTPAYMAPESARGGSIDSRADLYAVGCILYEALVGKPPFDGDNYNAILYAIANEEPPALRDMRPDVDAALAAVIATALAKDPARRFASAEAMLAALGPWTTPRAAPTPASSKPPSVAAFAPTESQPPTRPR